MSKTNSESTQTGEEATNLERSAGNSEHLRAGSAIRGCKLHSKTLAANAAKRTRAGQALIDSEAKYRRLFEAAQDGILILNPKTGVIVDVNPFLIKLLDYPRSYFLGKALWEIGLFSDIEASRISFRELKDKRYVRYDDLPLKSKAGQAINVEFVSNVYGWRVSRSYSAIFVTLRRVKGLSNQDNDFCRPRKWKQWVNLPPGWPMTLTTSYR
jgi:PAS domain S-box-containing protein